MNNRGSIILAVTFMVLTSFLGISLLNITLIHNRTIKARKVHEQRSELLHNKLVYHLHNDKEKIIKTKFKSSLTDFTIHFNKEFYPSVSEESVKIIKSFTFNSEDFELFKLIRGKYRIDTIASNKRHKWRSGSTFNIISGNIPINFIPLWTNSHKTHDKKKKSTNDSIFTSNQKNLPESGAKIIFDISKHIASIFEIGISQLNIPYLIELLTPEEKTSYLKEGIYMVQKAEKSGPVFIQGDICAIELSIEENKQIIELFQNNNYFKITYSPDFFSCVWNSQHEIWGYKFNEKFIINGNVDSIRSKTTPSISSNANPEFIIMGNVKIVSSIIRSKKYNSEENSSSITILCSSSPFRKKTICPNIIFSESNPLTIDGSINIQGNLINKSENLLINGNIYCKNIKNEGKMIVNSNKNMKPISWNNFFIKNFAFIKVFRTDFIEEVFDE